MTTYVIIPKRELERLRAPQTPRERWRAADSFVRLLQATGHDNRLRHLIAATHHGAYGSRALEERLGRYQRRDGALWLSWSDLNARLHCYKRAKARAYKEAA